MQAHRPLLAGELRTANGGRHGARRALRSPNGRQQRPWYTRSPDALTRSGLLDGIAAGSRCFPVSFETLARLLLKHATGPRSRRLLIGLTGPPGAGKTTFAQALCRVVDRVASER